MTYDIETGRLAVENGLVVLMDKNRTSKEADKTSDKTARKGKKIRRGK